MATSARHIACAVVVYLAAALRAPPPPQINFAPTIGILSVPLTTAGSPCQTVPSVATQDDPPSSCFSAFYSRWIESAGARAVLIPYDVNTSVLTALLDSVNGVLFTGGSLENLAFDTPYMVAAATIFDAVQEKNRAGVFFPLHGTCQGMQVLAVLAAKNESVMAYNAFNSENLSLPLDLTWDAHHSSRLFGVDSAPADIVGTLMTDNVTLNLHHDGVPVANFMASDALGAFFILLSTNFDRDGRAFVSTLEAWEFPITASQWHPERPQFEWRDVGINHTPAGLAAMAYMAQYLVSDARRNAQAFEDDALLRHYSVFSYAVVGAPDAYLSGYQWIVFTG